MISNIRDWNVVGWLACTAILTYVFFFGYLVIGAVKANRARGECKLLGYDDGSVTLQLKGYCAMEQRVPLDSLRANPPRPQGRTVAPDAVRWVAL